MDYGLQSSQLLLQAGTCDRGKLNYFSYLCHDIWEIPSLLNQSLGPECDCHQQAVEEVDDTEALMGF